MRNLIFATTGFVAGAALLTVIVVALPRTTTVTVKQSSPQVAMPMMGGSGVMSSAPATPASNKLTIRHVLKGCHVWSNGKTLSPMMELTLRSGGKLSIVDQDVDAHQLVQLSGPTKLDLGGPMLMNRGSTLTFGKNGVYRFRTKTVDVAGMSMDVATKGADNILRLVVTVT
jgi:hypothetical protein